MAPHASSAPISPARLGEQMTANGHSVPFAPDFDDLYHAAAGAWAQAQHVFLNGNGLPTRWQHRERFVILETGFGLGNNFLATWAAWRADPLRCKHLFFISIEKHPLTLTDLRQVHGAATDPIHQQLAAQLCQAWPPLTPGLHLLDFDLPDLPGKVTLMLAFGDVQSLMPKLTVSVDAFYLDGFAPAKNPAMWDARWLSRLNRLSAPHATAATWSVAREVRDALSKAGFDVHKAQGFQGKRDMLTACHQPFHAHVPLPGGLWPAPPTDCQQVLVVGGGLAGCASAWALTQVGWQVCLIEQHAQVATEASGNPGGLFHSIIHATDNLHTRAHRAAALFTAAVVHPWIKQGLIQGQCEGLLRLEQRLSDEQAHAWLHAQPWLQPHVAWLTQAQAACFSQVPVPSGGWLFQQGGWLSPSDYARKLLQTAERSGKLTRIMGQRVSKLVRCPSSGQWQALDVQGQCLASASSAVLCNAHSTAQLLIDSALSAEPTQADMWLKIRGQISLIAPAHSNQQGIHLPAHPIAGDGYGMATPDGRLIFGATAQLNDEDAAVRWADTALNMAQATHLGLLAEDATTQWPTSAIEGRTAWRASTPDRLPLVGAWPRMAADSNTAQGTEQVRRMARCRNAQGGLYVFSGLGSRGITWAALGARLLSHWVTGAPCPVETDLRDAMDPARFHVRSFRHRAK